MTLDRTLRSKDQAASLSPSALGRLTMALRESWKGNFIYLALIAVFIVFAFTLHDRGFLTSNNLLNIIRQSAIIAVVATAMVLVLAAGEIDLSVGAVAGLVSVVTAMTMERTGVIAAVLAGLGTGAAVGFVNGWITTRIGVPSFLTTLAMMGVAKGTAMWMSNTAAISIVNDNYAFIFGGGDIGPVPVLLIWLALATLCGHIVLRKTTFGRKVLATGGNSVAASYSGIKTSSVKAHVLLISSGAAAIAGLLYAGRLESGRYQLGEGDELSVIAAAVLGGNSLFGGQGTVVGAVTGALLIGIVNNGLLLMGLDYSQQLIVRGAIIVLAVAITQTKRRI